MKKKEMKNNPTAYFLQQASSSSDDYKDKINEFVSKLINLKSCVLCKEEYNFDEKIPRIMIHCGHTFCTACMKNFHKNRRVRCPLCLKLVKNIDSLDRLPVNHTIFSKMAEEHRLKSKKEGGHSMDRFEELTQKKLMGPMTAGAQKDNKKADENALYNNFMHPTQPITGNGAGAEGGEAEDIEWEYCEHHGDRVKHFYCTLHNVLACRVCKDVMHAKKECMVIDLYEVDDVPGFFNQIAEAQKERDLYENEEGAEVKSTNSI